MPSTRSTKTTLVLPGLICALLLSACQNLSESSPSEEAIKGTKSIDPQQHACLAEAIYFEARGTGRKGMRAVGEVILNRKASSKFPNTVCDVVDQRWNGSCQFSYRCDGLPEVYREPTQKALSEEIARELLANRGEDITNGALFFHAARMNPGWFSSLNRTGKFGNQYFYR